MTDPATEAVCRCQHVARRHVLFTQDCTVLDCHCAEFVLDSDDDDLPPAFIIDESNQPVIVTHPYGMAPSQSVVSLFPEPPASPTRAEMGEEAARVCLSRARTLPPSEANEARKCASAIRMLFGVPETLREGL